MTDEKFRITGDISQRLYEHFCDASYHGMYLDGKKFVTPTDEQWAALNEDPDDPSCAMILYRPSDGKFFEVELDVIVTETSPEARQKQLEYYQRLAAQHMKERLAKEQVT